MKIDFVDLSKLYKELKQDVLEDLENIIDSGLFMGSQSFEEKFAEYNESKYCVGVGSGTAALWLSLIATGVGPGDEVLVPATTFIATAFAVTHCGGTPIFVDVDPITYTLNVNNLEDALSERTKAIIPVHIYGQPADMEQITSFAKKHELIVIEDCAQSVGALFGGKKVGSIGNTGCFSFFPTKNLGGLAQGGAVITDEEDVARIVRELSNVGRATGSKSDFAHFGFNSRLDTVNAKFLEHGLLKLDDWNGARTRNAVMYDGKLKNLAGVKTPPTASTKTVPVYHLYEVKCENKDIRDKLKNFLDGENIATRIYYPKPCQRQDIYKNLYRECPVADELADTLLSLPMHPFLTEEQIEYVCEKVKEFYELQRN